MDKHKHEITHQIGEASVTVRAPSAEECVRTIRLLEKPSVPPKQPERGIVVAIPTPTSITETVSPSANDRYGVILRFSSQRERDMAVQTLRATTSGVTQTPYCTESRLAFIASEFGGSYELGGFGVTAVTVDPQYTQQVVDRLRDLRPTGAIFKVNGVRVP